MYNQNCGPLAGMTREQLLAALKAAQDAYVELMTGSKGVSYSYTQGDGTRSVTYTKANLADLNVFIGQLKRLGRGKASFATTVQLVDPDRLSNPQQQFDLPHIRGGIEIDNDGAPIAYYIREAHMGDWWSGAKTMTWQRIMKETEWGRPIVIHDFDHERAAQHRGLGILTPIVQRLKMLTKYDAAELEASILNAVFGAYIKSPYDQQMVDNALDGGKDDSLSAYQEDRMDFHKARRIGLNHGVSMIHLFPGEDIDTVNAARPNSNFKDFESAVLRNIAAATGLSTQQLTQDWSDVNYSSARSAMLEAWKTLTRRRDDFATGFAQPILTAFIEELHAYDDVPLPNGNVPHFLDAKAAYTRAKWIGPGRGWIDPVAEKKGAILGMDAGLSTLENEVQENAGEDWEEVLDQRKREVEAFEARGLTPPTWAQVDVPAQQTIQDPDAK